MENEVSVKGSVTQDDDLVNKVLEFLRKNIGGASQRMIRSEFNLSNEDYRKITDELVTQKKVIRYRCFGGGIKIAPVNVKEDILTDKNWKALEEVSLEKVSIEKKEEMKEHLLYKPFKNWANTRGGYTNVVDVANSHNRNSWENPDLIAVEKTSYEWFLGNYFEITAFEVKLKFDVYAIWQAAHYRRFSHYVYLVCLGKPDEVRDEGNLCDCAAELGVGIICATKAGYAGRGIAFQEVLSPARQNPKGIEVDQLLADYRDEHRIERPTVNQQIAKDEQHRKSKEA